MFSLGDLFITEMRKTKPTVTLLFTAVASILQEKKNFKHIIYQSYIKRHQL